MKKDMKMVTMTGGVVIPQGAPRIHRDHRRFEHISIRKLFILLKMGKENTRCFVIQCTSKTAFGGLDSVVDNTLACHHYDLGSNPGQAM